MEADINGIVVSGTPSEIKEYWDLIQEETKVTVVDDWFPKESRVDNIPDHVKKYHEGSSTWIGTNNKVEAWFQPQDPP